jgi:hypothetical protein
MVKPKTQTNTLLLPDFFALRRGLDSLSRFPNGPYEKGNTDKDAFLTGFNPFYNNLNYKHGLVQENEREASGLHIGKCGEIRRSAS